VGRATGLSRTTAWRLQKRGEFPAPYAISPGRVGYREDEVEAWRISRDHSGARAAHPAAILETPPAPRERTDTPPRSEAPEPRRQASSPEVVATVQPVASVTPPPASRSAVADLSAKRGKPGRRRSQHAQAIAQQILFDF
jgi:predicted DNA-binding transcriptional regulator AlpA